MLDGLFMLLTLSTVMAIASFLAGSLPLSFALSQSRLQLISTIGMGVLVGTSLIVIIPEGVDTLYSASSAETHDTHTHSRRNYIIPRQPLDVRWQQQQEETAYSQFSARDDKFDPTAPSPFGSMPGPVLPDDASTTPSSSPPKDPPKTPTEPGKIDILETHASPSSSPSPLPANTQKQHESRTPHAWIGISLTLGFILIYVAMHTMQENDLSGVGTEETMGGFGNGYLDSGGGGGMHRRDSRQGGKQVRSLRLLAAAVGGMLLPLITQMGHAH
ncbi:MAG: hypothetical protein L6R37_000876 [Teloschistes peruensis]|nr:MAG: hypothetical protein L6R37_000876 [Teloschistes peruensis]